MGGQGRGCSVGEHGGQAVDVHSFRGCLAALGERIQEGGDARKVIPAKFDVHSEQATFAISQQRNSHKSNVPLVL